MHSSHSMRGALQYMHYGEPGSKLDITKLRLDTPKRIKKEQVNCAYPGCQAVPEVSNSGFIEGLVEIAIKRDGKPVSIWLCTQHEKEMDKDQEVFLRALPSEVWLSSDEFTKKYR